MACEAATRYEFSFVCGDDIPYSEDGTRNGAERRARFQRWIVDDLEARGVEYTHLTGSLQRRIDRVRSALGLPERAAGSSE